jgi:hypothetical protein
MTMRRGGFELFYGVTCIVHVSITEPFHDGELNANERLSRTFLKLCEPCSDHRALVVL